MTETRESSQVTDTRYDTELRDGAQVRDGAEGSEPVGRTAPPQPAEARRPRREMPTAPYLEAIVSYGFRGSVRFHVPGHKGGPGADPGLRRSITEQLTTWADGKAPGHWAMANGAYDREHRRSESPITLTDCSMLSIKAASRAGSDWRREARSIISSIVLPPAIAAPRFAASIIPPEPPEQIMKS